MADTNQNDSTEMNIRELTGAMEAVLFAMGEAVEEQTLARALGVTAGDIRRIASRLDEKYAGEDSGLTLQRLDSSYQLSTRKEYYSTLISVVSAPRKLTLSDAVLETLSIIAYRQPVTKAEVEGIRGVSSDYAINKLLEYDLIRELGRKDAPGRPILFGTTDEFLRHFGISSASELPVPDTASMDRFRKEAEAEVDTKVDI